MSVELSVQQLLEAAAAPPPEFPPGFSWSHSKDRRLTECPRSYGLQYHFWRGGEWRDADPDARRVYTLKQLTTLPIELGQAIHRRAAECACAIQSGRDLPSLEEMVLATRREMSDVLVASRDIDAFLANPQPNRMLAEAFYRVDHAVPDQAVQRAREAMHAMLERLRTLPLWDELRALPDPAQNVIVPEPFGSFEFNGQTVYAAPDLVVRHAWKEVSEEIAAASWTVVDFKTGKTPNLGEVDQVALYGWYCLLGLGLPHNGGCGGRVINLRLDQDERISLGLGDLRDAGWRITRGMERLRRILVDDESGRPRRLAVLDLPQTTNLDSCHRCTFRGACWPETLPLDVAA